MTPEMWQRLKPLFDAAIEKPAAERERFVDEVCGDDIELKKELTALLKANDEQTGYIDTPVVNLGEWLPERGRRWHGQSLRSDGPGTGTHRA
jgi:hypothetical protein